MGNRHRETFPVFAPGDEVMVGSTTAVSYTHLDVYKRQLQLGRLTSRLREPPSLIPGLPRQHGPNDEAFGHMGAGGQIAFADPVARIGCGFVRNHLENQAMPLMGACLVDALYRCAGATR